METATFNMTTHVVNDTLSTTEPHENYFEIIDLPAIRIIFIFLYALIFILGISGNALVVFIVLRNKSMQTITNIFITNLAFSDIMMCLLAVPFTPISAYLKDWVFGKALCRIVPMTLGTSVYVSTLTSMAIAVDRYFVIVHPFNPRMTTSVCILLIVAIWIVSISISLPLGMYQTVTTLPNDDGTFDKICHENWPQTTARQFFAITSLVLQYLVPCSIITLCYTRVSLKLRSRSISRKGMVSRTRLREEQDIRRKRRTNKMLIAMVVIFVCCWLPINAVQITRDYFPQASRTSYFNLLFFLAHITAMSSTVYNPFLYAWMNDVFRKEFRSILPCLFSSNSAMSLNLQTQNYTAVDTKMSQVPVSPCSTMLSPLPVNESLKFPKFQKPGDVVQNGGNNGVVYIGNNAGEEGQMDTKEDFLLNGVDHDDNHSELDSCCEPHIEEASV